jgi:hypothetical protein
MTIVRRGEVESLIDESKLNGLTSVSKVSDSTQILVDAVWDHASLVLLEQPESGTRAGGNSVIARRQVENTFPPKTSAVVKEQCTGDEAANLVVIRLKRSVLLVN